MCIFGYFPKKKKKKKKISPRTVAVCQHSCKALGATYQVAMQNYYTHLYSHPQGMRALVSPTLTKIGFKSLKRPFNLCQADR
jgi:hypothetical protein